jgi:hypothetical protein
MSILAHSTSVSALMNGAPNSIAQFNGRSEVTLGFVQSPEHPGEGVESRVHCAFIVISAHIQRSA